MHSQSILIDGALRIWFGLTALSVAYVAADAVRRNPEMVVMKWGWALVTLYTGPIGAALYVLSCQEPAKGTHERFVTPLWKQSLGSTIHCMAGDATGIVIAASVTATLGLSMGVDVVVEYVFGFAVGLFIFQALFMRVMLGGSYAEALRRSILPEWISMNAVMAGMVPTMVVLMTRHMSAMEPSSPRFWGVMSLATLVGAIVAYPFNVWLVAAKLKHGMGTVRVLGEGGHPVHAERAAEADRGSTAAAPPAGSAPMSMGDSMSGKHMGVSPPGMPMSAAATVPQITAVTLLSVLALAAGVLLAALYGEVTMERGMMMSPAVTPASTRAPRSMP